MKKSIVLFILSVFILACSNNGSDSLTGSKKINIATGMNVVDNNGNIIAVLGNPNILTNLKLAEKVVSKTDSTITVSDVTSSNSINIYPTVVNDAVNINAIEKIEGIWFVKTQINKNFNDVDFTNSLTNDLYAQQEITAISLYDFDFEGISSVTIDVSNFENGIYKVFIKLESQNIFWENISVGYTYEDIVDFW